MATQNPALVSRQNQLDQPMQPFIPPQGQPAPQLMSAQVGHQPVQMTPQAGNQLGQQYMNPHKGHPVQSMMRGEQSHLFTKSDSNVMMKQIYATHAPDGRTVDVKPLLNVIEDILQHATPAHVGGQASSQAHIDEMEEKAYQVDFIGMLEALAYTIHKISCEISCKCSGGGDAHATTVASFNTLTSYWWDAKLVLALAAFAVNYGQFWLVAQLYPANHLAKSIALLKQLPQILERNEALRPRFEALKTLIKAMLDVTKCIVEFTELPPQYINPDTPVMVMAWAHIPTAVYWTIRSVVECSSQIVSLIGLGHNYISSTSEVRELSTLAHKLDNKHGHLRKQLVRCCLHVGLYFSTQQN